MYNETYHPLEGDNLKDILYGLTEDEQRIAIEQINAATENKVRKYRVTIAPPVGDYPGVYFIVDNGQVIESSDLGRK